MMPRFNQTHRLLAPKFTFPFMLILLACLVNGPILKGHFLDDDLLLIKHNPGIKNIAYLWQNISRDYFDDLQQGGKVGYYRPVTRLSFMMDYALWGLNPAGFRATNLMIHAAVTLVLYFLAQAYGLKRTTSFMAGTLFAVYPLHVSALSISSARSDLWCTLFFTLALLYFEKGRTRNNRLSGLCVSNLWFFLALLGKEMAASLPLIIFFRAWLLSRQKDRNIVSGIPNAVKTVLPYACTTIFYIFLRWSVLHVEWAFIETKLSLMQHTASISLAFWKYLHLLVIPHQYTFIEYLLIPASFTILHALLLLLGGILVFLLLYIAMKEIRPAAWLLFTILTLSPLLLGINHIRNPGTAYFLPLSERFLYLPTLFAALAWSEIIHFTVNRSMAQKILNITGFAMAGLFAIITLVTIPNFYSTHNLFLSLAAPLDAIPETELDLERRVFKHWSAGLRFLGRSEYEQAVIAYQKARKYKPWDLKLAAELATALSGAERNPEAEQLLKTALSASFLAHVPTDDANRLLNPVRLQYGRLLAILNRPQEALDQLNLVLEKEPENSAALEWRGRTLLKVDQPQEAAHDWEKRIRQTPNDTKSWYFLGMAKCRSGESAAALQAFSKALAGSSDSRDRQIIRQNMQKVAEGCK